MDDAVWGHDEAKRKIVRMMVQKLQSKAKEMFLYLQVLVMVKQL